MWFFRKRKRKGDLSHQKFKPEARAVIHSRLKYFAPRCEVVYKRVAIRNTKRSWGSCSSLGNLNFNYKLLFMPPCLRDYIIVHELCHLKELNHSPRFWLEVERVLPNYREHVTALRHMEKTHGTSLKAITDYTKNHNCLHCSNLSYTQNQQNGFDTKG
ncbi:MAG: M48 family metallopeptidase [Candidatus Nomurabacteria bacterium]|nr:MAG: M48 family metallopeptidase [Candidatus Nomurabacteria bacterium]